MGGIDRSAATDDLSTAHARSAAAFRVLDPDGAVSFKQYARRVGSKLNLEVGSTLDRVVVRACGAPALTVLDVSIKAAEALLLGSVYVFGDPVTGLLRRFKECVEEGTLGAPAFNR